jgi:hypothetical protein
MASTISPTMSKKKKPKTDAPPPKKEVLYVEMDAELKQRLVRLSELPHRRRKITAEATIAILRYVEEEEAREGLPPLSGE